MTRYVLITLPLLVIAVVLAMAFREPEVDLFDQPAHWWVSLIFTLMAALLLLPSIGTRR